MKITVAYSYRAACALTAVLLTAGSSCTANAEQPPVVPVVVTIAEGINFSGTSLGLLGEALADAFMNKRGADQVKAFRAGTPGIDWSTVDLGEFGCIPGPSVTPCPQPIRWDAASGRLETKLKTIGTDRALVISILQLFDGHRFRARATLNEVETTDRGLHTGRVLSAIVESDGTRALRPDDKSDAAAWRHYWSDGEHSRLEMVGRSSVSEMAKMLRVLYEATSNAGSSKPSGWPELPGVKDFEAAGRLKCHGLCGGTRVFKADPDSIWLATTAKSGQYGWTLVSIDQETALINSNFMAYVLSPVL